jgi:hypothetical protein
MIIFSYMFHYSNNLINRIASVPINSDNRPSIAFLSVQICHYKSFAFFGFRNRICLVTTASLFLTEEIRKLLKWTSGVCFVYVTAILIVKKKTDRFFTKSGINIIPLDTPPTSLGSIHINTLQKLCPVIFSTGFFH